jgi:hypothetical protein
MLVIAACGRLDFQASGGDGAIGAAFEDGTLDAWPLDTPLGGTPMAESPAAFASTYGLGATTASSPSAQLLASAVVATTCSQMPASARLGGPSVASTVEYDNVLLVLQ